MDPGLSGADTRETRILAAIVFTDVVGFSRLASQNEARVYVALQRDMGVMTSLCRAHGGQVLNTMGDGMLLCFMSAVDAMTCAIEIQRTLFNAARSLPATDVLQHRIGVHLGDVIMSGDNVFGDGVNIAARLQAVAKPGAVSFSHTVHEVVKNKLDLSEAKSVGRQQLKNLGEPINIWQIPPLTEGRAPVLLDDLPKSQVEAEAGASGLKGLMMVVASIVLVGALVGLFLYVKVPKGKPATPTKTNANKDEPSAPTNNPTDVTTAPKMNAAQIRTEVERLRNGFDFAGVVALIQHTGAEAPEEIVSKRGDYANLDSLMRYVQGQISQATISAPLRFEMSDQGQIRSYELVGTPSMQIKDENGMRPISLTELGPAGVLAVARSVSKLTLQRAPAPPEVAGWCDVFQKEFGL